MHCKKELEAYSTIRCSIKKPIRFVHPEKFNAWSIWLFKLFIIGLLSFVVFGYTQYSEAANSQMQPIPVSVLAPIPLNITGAQAQPKPNREIKSTPTSTSSPESLNISIAQSQPKSGIQNFSGWTTLFSEGFEGAFPYSGWTVSGDPTWDDDDYLPHTGYWSAWCANGGTHGLDPAVSNYTTNMGALMVYGPFSLTSCSDAEVSFY